MKRTSTKKRYINSAWERFFRSFALSLLIGLCPLVLLFGIAVADKNTRAVSLETVPPAIAAERDDDILTFTVFGRETSVNLGFLRYLNPVKDKLMPFIPPEVRLALSGAEGLFKPDQADGE
jgi:hypothetical protein